MKFLLLTLLSLSWLFGAQLLSPVALMQENFTSSTITKENILLTQEQVQRIEKSAKKKLSSKIVRIFYAKKESTLLGLGVILSQKVRSQNGVVLYIFDATQTLQSIEVVAFNEPLEYLPSQAWQEQFHGKTQSDALMVGRDIPTITGATLSARSITDGARLAFGVAQEVMVR
jgi:Na+-translocating ferredoxin:NAD+ oxidoreductase RnfG subunit